MVEIERGQHIVGLNTSSSAVFGPALFAPRGALKLLIRGILGSFGLSTQIATPGASAVALIRRVINQTITSIETMNGLDVLVSRVVTNADLGTPTDSSQWNSFDINKQWERDVAPSTRDKPGAAQRGFQMMMEQDGSAIVVQGLFTIEYEIHWPETSRTRDLGRIRRMGMMNQPNAWG